METFTRVYYEKNYANESEEIVGEILHDLLDRRGIRQTFGGFDDDIKEEIIIKMIQIVENVKNK